MDNFHDFEDCLQYECAKTAGATFIITCNVRDFAAIKDINIITPAEAVAMINAQSGDKRDIVNVLNNCTLKAK